MKKIRIDFTKTEERSGWNTRQMPEGLHAMKIVAVQETEAQDGTTMLVYALVPTDSRYASRRFPFYCKLQQNQLWKLRDLLVAAGESVPKKAIQIDPSKVIGSVVAAEVVDDNYQGNLRSSVQGTYAADVLGEVSSDDSEEDDYDELEEELEEDEFDEEAGFEEEDFDEDDFEEDDFDDEEFDDEDFEEEEEEEEPAPAPKRRAASASKAKPAARTVQRRR